MQPASSLVSYVDDITNLSFALFCKLASEPARMIAEQDIDWVIHRNYNDVLQYWDYSRVHVSQSVNWSATKEHCRFHRHCTASLHQ